MADRTQSLRIAFCHPDLGLGGAERLVVDAACELCEHGHTVGFSGSSKPDSIMKQSNAKNLPVS